VHHEECWYENKGCSTYGCPKVNALNPPVRIDIPFGSGNQPNYNHQPNYGSTNYGNQPNYGNNFILPPVHPALQKIKFAFHGWWISWVVFWLLAILFATVNPEDTQAQAVFEIFVRIPWAIFGCILFYRLWNVTDVSVRNNVGAGNAAAGFFIPFYNIYWFVTGLYRLPDNINKTLSLRGINHRVNVCSFGGWIGALWLIFSYMGTIPDPGILNFCIFVTFLIVPVMLLFYYLSCIKGAEQILNGQHYPNNQQYQFPQSYSY
jgi:hypothetical protein